MLAYYDEYETTAENEYETIAVNWSYDNYAQVKTRNVTDVIWLMLCDWYNDCNWKNNECETR